MPGQPSTEPIFKPNAELGAHRVRERLIDSVLTSPHKLGWFVGKTRLINLHSYWLHLIFNSPLPADGRCTPFQAHRGSYKTTALVEIGVIYWLLFHPDARIAVLRKTFTSSEKERNAIVKMFENDDIRKIFKVIHGAFPDLESSRSGSLLFKFKNSITKENSVDFYGIHQLPTGSHYDLIIMDDIVTLQDRYSKAERDKTCNSVMELVNILDPESKLVFFGTPWHPEDAFNAKNAEGKPIFNPPTKFTVYDAKLFSKAEIEKRKSQMTDELWGINYELEHRTSLIKVFKDAKFREWNKFTSPIFAHIDAKYKGDHTGALTIGQKDPRGDGYTFMGFMFTENVNSVMHVIVEKLFQYRVKKVFVENNPDQGWVATKLREFSRGLFYVDEYHEATNKYVKIVTYAKYNWDKIWFADDTEDEYIQQIMDYEEGREPDDCPDSLASLFRGAFSTKPGGVLYGS
ncbi:hypothetical protein [Treponema sp. R6D11]